MSGLLCDRKGITLMEVLVSVVLITIGVLGMLTLMPSGWRLSGTSDSLGRAAGILQAELESQEILLMNPNNTPAPIPPPGPTKTVFAGGTVPQPGDTMGYTVQTSRTQPAGLGGGWLVQVQVTWPTRPAGIRESLIVRPQQYFRQ